MFEEKKSLSLPTEFGNSGPGIPGGGFPDFGMGGGGQVGAPVDDGSDDLVFDLTDTPEKVKYQVVPPGTYNAIVQDCNFKMSSKGNPMLEFQYAIVGGELDGRKLYSNVVLVEAGLPRLKQLMVRVAPDIKQSEFRPKRDAQLFCGRPCQVVVRIKPYQGEMRNEVKEVLAPATSTDSFFGQGGAVPPPNALG